MYERAFETEWTTLSRADAIERAFALGVAAGIGNARPAELDRIKATLEGAYDRSLLELAYDEGRTKALEAPESTPDAVWDRLVDDTGTPQTPPFPAALPGALSQLAVSRNPRAGPPSSLEFPPMFKK